MTCVIILRTILLSGVQLYPAISWVIRKCNTFWANKTKKGIRQLLMKSATYLQISDYLSKMVPFFFLLNFYWHGISRIVAALSDTKILMTWHNQDIKPPSKVLLQSISNKESDILPSILIKKTRKCSLSRTKRYENMFLLLPVNAKTHT